MGRTTTLSIASCLLIAAVHAEQNSSKKPDIKEKALFKGKEYYDKRLQKKFQKEANKTKEIKVYKRKDGSIDTFKTYDKARD